MKMAILTMLTALGLAVIAAWFSVVGIMAIFAGAAIPALIMGAGIEAGKLVGVSWLYRNWKNGPWIKHPLLIMTFVAMMLTSIGIFGFLSKAHLEQGAPVANNQAQVELINNKIANKNLIITQHKGTIAHHQSTIENAQQELAGLDAAIQVLIDYNKISDEKDGAIVRRKEQAPDRERIALTIEKSQNKIEQTLDKIEIVRDDIATLNEQQLEYSQILRDYEVEVGPIKYIAAVIYDDPKNNLDNAVRIMVFIIMFVFDPMAIILLMAGNHLLMKEEQNKIKPDGDGDNGIKIAETPIIPIDPDLENEIDQKVNECYKEESITPLTPKDDISVDAEHSLPPVTENNTQLTEFRNTMKEIDNRAAEYSAEDVDLGMQIVEALKNEEIEVQPHTEMPVLPEPEPEPELEPEATTPVVKKPQKKSQYHPNHKLQLQQPKGQSVFDNMGMSPNDKGRLFQRLVNETHYNPTKRR